MGMSDLFKAQLSREITKTQGEVNQSIEHVSVDMPMVGRQPFTVVPNLDAQTIASFDEKMRSVVKKLLDDDILPKMALRALTEDSTYPDFAIFSRELNHLANDIQRIAMMAYEQKKRSPDTDLMEFLKGNIRDIERVESNFAIALSAMMRLDDTMQEIRCDRWKTDEQPTYQIVNNMSSSDERKWRDTQEWVKRAPHKNSQEWHDAVNKAREITLRLIKGMGLEESLGKGGLPIDVPHSQTSLDNISGSPKIGQVISSSNKT